MTNNCELCGEPMPESESMFKYHGYGGPCPKPPLQKAIVVEEKSKIEGGWVIERGQASAPEYASVVDGMLHWTKDNLKALRFARREDAEMLSEIYDDEVERICFHEWG